MPNIVMNSLDIKGNDKSINEFKLKTYDGGTFNICAHVPVPIE